MPFGISSAPEVFQRRMHEVMEGLSGIEVVADDFVAVGSGESHEQAIRDHDEHLEAFIQRCVEKNLKLNDTKFKLKQQEVPFIGHIATQMACVWTHTKYKLSWRCHNPMVLQPFSALILGLAEYLSKFLPHLSDITKSLREQTQKDTERTWGTAQQEALDA